MYRCGNNLLVCVYMCILGIMYLGAGIYRGQMSMSAVFLYFSIFIFKDSL